MYLIKTDSSGNEQWEKTYGGASDEVALDIIQMDDKGYFVFGYTESYKNPIHP